MRKLSKFNIIITIILFFSYYSSISCAAYARVQNPASYRSSYARVLKPQSCRSCSQTCKIPFCRSCPYFEIVGGYGIAKLGVGNPRIKVNGFETATLHRENSNAQAGDATIGIGYVIPFLDVADDYCDISWLPSFAIQVNYHHLTQGLTGQLHKRSSHHTDYNLSLNNNRVMVDFLLTLGTLERLSGFVIGGAGEGWTRVGYNDRTFRMHKRGGFTLNNRTDSGLTSEIGGGFMFDVTPDFGVTLQYLYVNFSDMQMARKGRLNGRQVRVFSPQFPFHAQEVLLLFTLK